MTITDSNHPNYLASAIVRNWDLVAKGDKVIGHMDGTLIWGYALSPSGKNARWVSDGTTTTITSSVNVPKYAMPAIAELAAHVLAR